MLLIGTHAHQQAPTASLSDSTVFPDDPIGGPTVQNLEKQASAQAALYAAPDRARSCRHTFSDIHQAS